MEHAKKYALVPEEMLTRHTISNKQLSDLDKSMIEILNSSLEDHEKVSRYYDLLQKRLKMNQFNSPYKLTEVKSSKEEENSDKETEESPITIKKEDRRDEKLGDSYDSIILNSIPPNLKRRADNALSILKSRPDILKWNNQGEICYRGETIPQTNIADLFNLMFTDKKKTHILAKNTFLSALEELNLPKQYIRNKYLKLPITVKIPDVEMKNKSDVSPQAGEKKWESY